jgi:ribose transport system permease protein
MKKELGILILLIVICVIVALINPQFVGASNIQNTLRLIGLYGIFSIGVGLVIITGGIDLSIGSVLSLFGVLLAFMLVQWHWSWPLALFAVLAGSAFLGLCHGLLVTKVKIQPFIVTLCGLLLYRGIARYIADDQTQGLGYCAGFEGLQSFLTGSLMLTEKFGIPVPFLLLVAVGVVMWVVLHRSVYGRYLFAVGRNEEATRYAGIRTHRVIIAAYVLATLLTGISAILLIFYTNSVSPSSHGNFYELYAIAAAVLGGCSLRGGEGSIFGIVIGTSLILVLRNIVNMLGIASSLEFAVLAVVILFGVILDQLMQRKA